MHKLGIIDIGSNSVRLLFDGEKKMTVTQLAQNNVPGQPLSKVACDRTAAAVFEFADFVRKNGGCVRAFATEAVRSASDGKLFAERLIDGGVPTEILSPETEARIGFVGAYDGTGTKAVLDVGGASSELIVGSSDGILYSRSLPIGSVRASDMRLSIPALHGAVARIVENYGDVPAFERLLCIGGTASTLLAVKLGLAPYDPARIHLGELTKSDIAEIVKAIDSTPLEERVNIRGLHPKKLLTASPGGVVIEEIMSYLKIDSVTVSENDNLEGYLKLLSERE